MTPLQLMPLRLAATVAHALPGVRLRLRRDDTIVLDVRQPPLPGDAAVTPCAFRSAVARAHRQLEAGVRLRFLGLDEGESPGVDVGVPPGGAAFPSGIYRVRCGDAQLHAFATTLALADCRSLLAADDLEVDESVRLHHDAATDVTLVHTVHAAERPVPSPPWPLEELLVRCFAEEVSRALAVR